MSSENEIAKIKITWTPEQKIQAFKEIITAILGVLIVGFTLFFAIKTFAYVGDSKITEAKDILHTILGVAGVVIGYYFGRVPADARAVQAQEQADAANAQTEQVNAQTQAVVNQIEQIMDKVTPTSPTARGTGAQPFDTLIIADLQRIRDELRALAIVSKHRR
jgi:apolipoprotein N-acyltransferase